MRTICCQCQRLKEEGGGWVRVAGLLADRLSHGYCPECYDKAMQAIRQQGGSASPPGGLPAGRISQK